MISFGLISSLFMKVASSVGMNLISKPIEDYISKRFKIFEKKVNEVKDEKKIILIQKEVITLKNMQIQILENIIKEDISQKEKYKLLKEYKEKTIFINEIEKLLDK